MKTKDIFKRYDIVVDQAEGYDELPEVLQKEIIDYLVEELSESEVEEGKTVVLREVELLAEYEYYKEDEYIGSIILEMNPVDGEVIELVENSLPEGVRYSDGIEQGVRREFDVYFKCSYRVK